MDDEKRIIEKIRENMLKKDKIAKEINSLSKSLESTKSIKERGIISSQIENLKKAGDRITPEISEYTRRLAEIKKTETPGRISADKKPADKKAEIGEEKTKEKIIMKKPNIPYTSLEKSTLKRLKRKEEKIAETEDKKPNNYIKISNKIFYNFSLKILSAGVFGEMKRDVVKSNLKFVPATYLSIVFSATLLSGIISLILFFFFLFFSISSSPPFIISVDKGLFTRIFDVFWILIVIPLLTFVFAYLYPSMERKSLENSINSELPFATMHMSSISSSMIEPSKIFSIIISTKEYPYLEKEFVKLQNEINIYGYDLVTALKNRAHNSASEKLAELFNGIAITITSGGNLPEFFEKRSQNLLFEHRLDMEKQSRSAETFMDIYISIVIASPMILMLLLMMMSLSGLGISLNPATITIVMLLSVSMINIFFLVFLQLKQPKT